MADVKDKKSMSPKSKGHAPSPGEFLIVIIAVFAIIGILLFFAVGSGGKLAGVSGVSLQANDISFTGDSIIIKLLSILRKYVSPVFVVLNLLLLGLLIFSIIKAWPYQRPYLSLFYKRIAKHRPKKSIK